MASDPSKPTRRLPSWLPMVILLLGVAGLLIWQRMDRTNPQVGGTKALVITSGDTYEKRLESAIRASYSTKLSDAAQQDLSKKKGKILVDSRSSVSGWPAEAKFVEIGATDPVLREALLATDEQTAARILRDQGIGVVILQWRLAPSLDRDRRVLSRLYNHDELSSFSLFRITEDLLMYQVLESPVGFPPQLAATCVTVLRALLSGEQPPEIPNLRAPEGRWNFMASVRGQGRELAIGLSRDEDLRAALTDLADDLERGHRRYMEWYGLPPLQVQIKDLVIEIHRITELADVETRNPRDLAALWEMGIDGAVIRDAKAGKSATFPGSVSYTRAYRDIDTFLQRAAAFHALDDRRPWEREDVSLEMVRDHHYMELPGKGVVYLVRGVPHVPLDKVNLDRLRQAIVLGGEWYLANLLPDGRVLYKWWPSENRESNEYNHVRHTLSTWNLLMAYRLDPRPEFLDAAKKALAWTQLSLVQEGDMAFYEFDNNRKLGSVAVSLLGMLELAQVTGDRSNDEMMQRLGRFVKFMQEPSGKFRGYYVDESHPYFSAVNDIVPGEAALSLIWLADYFKDPTWIEGLPRYWQYYTPWFRERAAKVQKDKAWPAYTYEGNTRLELVQMGPWTVIAANAYYRSTGDKEVAKFGLEVARWMIDTYEWSSDRSPWLDYVGGYFKMEGELPAMQAFCYAEGTAAAYQLALQAAPDEAAFFEKATRESMRFGLVMQYDNLTVYPFSRPWQVKGGIRYAMNETKVRIDYVHHAMSAMYLYLRAAETDSKLPESVKATQPPQVDLTLLPWEQNRVSVPSARTLRAATPEKVISEKKEATEEDGD